SQVPLPPGAARRRVRVGPHPALRASFSPREKDSRSPPCSLFWTLLVYDRPYLVDSLKAGAHRAPLQLSDCKFVHSFYGGEFHLTSLGKARILVPVFSA